MPAFAALAVDLDGTLLVGDHLPEENRLALARAHAAGYRVFLATARWHQMALRIAADIGVCAPVIACSGAQVHLPEENRDLFDERLPADFVERLYEACDAMRCIATVTIDDQVLLKLDGEPDWSQVPPEMQVVEALAPWRQVAPRIAAIQGTAICRHIKRELEPRFRARVHFKDSIGPTGRLVLALTSIKADKGLALQALCEWEGIDPGRVVAFGDADNDIAMFELAGASVAMGQAHDHVKRAASVVTSRNDENGVAQAVNRLLETGDIR